MSEPTTAAARPLKVDAVTYGSPLAEVGADAATAASRGHDGWFVSETTHDPLLACTAAGLAASGFDIGTAITVAFPRSPMHVAYAAHDLQALTGGRFVLGLGTQIKPHIERRFSSTWSQPAARMREYVLALHAIWDAWATGGRLDFQGEFYRHTLMTPFFTPPAHGFGVPRVWLAAVGPKMTEVTGEVADGLLCHGFTTAAYLEQVTVPRLTAGASRAGRTRDDVEVVLPVFVVTGDTAEERAATEAMVKGQIGFYGSTPAYRGVLDLHGWGELHEELHRRSTTGGWDTMPELIDDEVLHAFAVVAEPADVGTAIRERYGHLVDRISLSTSYAFGDEVWAKVLRDLRGG
jgi:probable F420-dependent oxidoreductase